MKITILGGGAMATACSVLLAEQPEHSVSIWARNPDYAAQMQQHRENKRLLPGITLPTAVTITSEIAAAVADTGARIRKLGVRRRTLDDVFTADVVSAEYSGRAPCPGEIEGSDR